MKFWYQSYLQFLWILYCWDSSGVYICKSIVNYLRHGNYICKSEGNYLFDNKFRNACSIFGISIKQKNFKLVWSNVFIVVIWIFFSLHNDITVSAIDFTSGLMGTYSRWNSNLPAPIFLTDSSGVYICKSVVNYLRHGNYICKSKVIYLSSQNIVYDDKSVLIPVEFKYVNQ